ncbi:MAG: carboxypeptidase-like regulatory domain-containing protein [Bernardetiaceae bacterium]|nr:carboxypeptidase-like regulatory domain-containing protein [Bernardetiaceae bacterium]
MCKIQIQIPKPCHQKWTEMTPSEQGRFCQGCQKEVQDFSQLTDKEIIKRVQFSKGEICGHFRKSQLNRPLKMKTHSSPPKLWQWLFAGALTAFAAQETAAQGQLIKAQADTVQTDASIQKSKAQTTQPEEWFVKGIVIDPDLGFPLQGTIIRNEGSKQDTTTNSEGYFFMKVSAKDFDKQDNLTISVHFLGYEKQEITISKQELPKKLHIELNESVILVDGFIQKCEPRITGGAAIISKEVKKTTPWQRTKSFFRRFFKSKD